MTINGKEYKYEYIQTYDMSTSLINVGKVRKIVSKWGNLESGMKIIST